jgi:hypothetical protein
MLDSCPVKSIQDIIDSGIYSPGDNTRAWLDSFVDYPYSPFDDPACEAYEQMKLDGESLVLSMMRNASVDFILYPVFNRLPTLMDPDPDDPFINLPFTFLSASTGMPSITFPVAYAEVGVPIALSLTGPRYSEGELIALAYGYEQQVFSAMYHPSALYPPLSENEKSNNDEDEIFPVVLFVFFILSSFGIVAAGVFYYFFKLSKETGKVDLGEPLL